MSELIPGQELFGGIRDQYSLLLLLTMPETSIQRATIFQLCGQVFQRQLAKYLLLCHFHPLRGTERARLVGKGTIPVPARSKDIMDDLS